MHWVNKFNKNDIDKRSSVSIITHTGDNKRANMNQQYVLSDFK